MDIKNYYIDGYNLTIDKVVAAIKGELGAIYLSPNARIRCEKSRKQVTKWLEKDAPVVYGINTGLGNLKDSVLSPEDHLKWNKTIPYPHAVGFGNYTNPYITRASLLIRANVLSRGYSAVRPELIQRMLDIFNQGISPAVFELGSTGLSDLGPLAQSAMVVAGLDEAEVFYNGEKVKAQESFKQSGLEPTFQLECKEVLSQMNGSTMTQAMAVVACHNMQLLLDIDEQISKSIYKYKNLPIDSKEKVSSAVEQTFKFILKTINFENNISCDNPLLFKVEEGTYEPVMGCNCSNTQVGYVLDLLNVLIAEKSNFIYAMICQMEESKDSNRGKSRLAESLLREMKALCIPASADSIPTKGNQEDHVEFSYGAARKSMKALEYYQLILSYLIEVSINIEIHENDVSDANILQDIKEHLETMRDKDFYVNSLEIINTYLENKYYLLGFSIKYRLPQIKSSNFE